ncbi:uncharacterized protein LOC108601481 [Drosophila busckii]|uniref:uncharacterized protein LOC108601481 n=1 Tax=Drosophila busckii TaxID=30019 RepID=UPI001432D15C|nr:uncharacterized protein LOC108601481 [Drosophila busckii]
MCDLKALALFLATCASAAALVRTETVRLSNYWHCLKLLPLLLLLLAACICPAVYSSLMVRPPHKAVIADFDELLASDVHVMLVRSAFEHFPADFRAKYAAAFRLTENVTNLLTMRSSYNTNWGYLVSTFNWLVVQQQQQHFQQPLFRYSDLCMHRLAHYSAILGENSIYRQALDLHIMRTQQSGLLKHWLKHSFYDLVKTGRMQLKDYSSKRMRWPLRVQDLRTSFICLLAGLSLAFFVLLLELIYFYGKIYLNYV